MALFGRERLPSRSTLSRFLASLTQPPVEALRTLFLDDLLARPLNKERPTGGLGDRAGKERVVFDIDGTREAARQRAEPVTSELPAPQRRWDAVCAPGSTGRKRGEVVRTRTTISQAHTSPWFGSFANPGNGLYREELRQAVAARGLYSKAYGLPEELILLRLDGPSATGAASADLAGFSSVTRGKDDTVLDRAEVQIRLHLPADQRFSRPESDLVRALYDCPDVPVGPTGPRSRVVVATHPTNARKSRIGVTRAGVVYERFFTNVPQSAFTAADVVAFYLHRGALKRSLPMKTRNKSPTAGGVTRLPGRRRGRSSIHGSGTCGWNWDTSFIPIHCAPPSLLLLVRVRKRRRLTPRLPYQEMDHQMWPRLGNKDASLAATLPESPMGHGAVRLDRRFVQTSGVRKAMGVCAWCMPPVSRVAVPVLYASSVNGMAKPLANLARSVCCCARSSLATPPSSGVTGAADSIDVPVCSLYVITTSRCGMPRTRPARATPRLRLRSLRSRSGRTDLFSWAERLMRNARAPAEGQIRIKLFGVPEHFADFLGLRAA